MNPDDLLAQLNDIHSPDPVSWWPLAPGWWVLLALCLALLGGAFVWFIKRHKRRRYLKQAQDQLQELLRAELSAADFIEAINSTLKRVVLQHSADLRVGTLSGQAWLEYLDQALPHKRALFAGGAGQALGEIAYQPNPEVDRQALVALTIRWVRCHNINPSLTSHRLNTQDPTHV